MNWSPDGKVLAAVEATGEVRLLDGTTFEPIKSFKPPSVPNQFLWTPDSKQFVMTGSQAVLWDVETNKQVSAVAVSGVADWVKPGESLVFGRGDGMLEVRSMAGLPQARLADRGESDREGCQVIREGWQLSDFVYHAHHSHSCGGLCLRRTSAALPTPNGRGAECGAGQQSAVRADSVHST